MSELPGEWTRQPIGSLARVLVSTVDKKQYEGEISVRLANYTDVYYSDEIVNDPNFMTATASRTQVAAFTVRAGDVAITKDSETSDDIGISAIAPYSLPGVVWGYHLAIYRAFDARYSRFIKRLFESQPIKMELAARTPGVTRVGLSSNTLRYLRVPVPPAQEAALIADYLDRETTEIDAFIADQEELIALLEERRGRVISEAISGSRSTDDRKATNITWASTVPASWAVSRASRFVKVTLGKMLDEGRAIEVGAEMTPYLRAANLSRGALDLDDIKFMPFLEAERLSLDIRAGDLLVTEGGASVGVNVFCVNDFPNISFQKTVNRVRSLGQVSTRYFGLVLDAMRSSGYLGVLSGGSTIPHLTAEKLEGIVIPWPSRRDQDKMVDEISALARSTDSAVADAREAIALSKERRAALISAAVTGQIDVTQRKRVLV